jgi:hypothetical protein
MEQYAEIGASYTLILTWSAGNDEENFIRQMLLCRLSGERRNPWFRQYLWMPDNETPVKMRSCEPSKEV